MPGNPRLVYAWLTMKNQFSELALIERIRSEWGTARHGIHRHLVLGIGDDCAILRPPKGHELLVTTDFSLEGRHLRRDLHPPESVGHRALARGLSDLAAMGARPLAPFLSLALPADLLTTRAGRAWVERFFTGLRTLADRYQISLAGGDTSESPCGLVLADIVLIGSAPAGRALRRNGAHPGDAIYVTGQLGGAAAELAAMQLRAAKSKSMPGAPAIPRLPRNGSRLTPQIYAAHPHIFPQPRIPIGLALLRRSLATAAIDLSDGLSTDLTHLCHESAVGAEIFATELPIHPLAQQSGSTNALELALHGGEDYELLFTASPTTRVPRTLAGVLITRVGSLVPGKCILLISPDGRRTPLQSSGWEHFSNKH